MDVCRGTSSLKARNLVLMRQNRPKKLLHFDCKGGLKFSIFPYLT